MKRPEHSEIEAKLRTAAKLLADAGEIANKQLHDEYELRRHVNNAEHRTLCALEWIFALERQTERDRLAAMKQRTLDAFRARHASAHGTAVVEPQRHRGHGVSFPQSPAPNP